MSKLLYVLLKIIIVIQKVANKNWVLYIHSVHNRDNQRRVGLYHEIIYSASVVYQINRPRLRLGRLCDKRPQLHRLFHDRDLLASDYPYIIVYC